MAETSGFFDAEQLLDDTWDREYLAESWANYFKLFVGNGVFATPVNQLKVVAHTGMNVKVLPGWAFINGYWYHNDSDLTLPIPANVMTTAITDGIFIQFDSANRITSAVVGNNRTAVDRISPHYELKIAEVTVAVGATEITDAAITDTRPNESVCGFVSGLINVINTNDLFQQYTDIFTTWFEEIKGQLDEDAAGHLQNEIDEMRAAGLSGSIFDITTVNSELHGKTVTASQGAFSKSATFDNNGVAQITGFTHIGSVHIESTDGSQIAGADITTPYFARYSVAIAFWAAVVNISTTTSQLYGQTITVKKNGNVVGTTAFNDSGQATYTAPSTGIYTFECEYGGQIYSSSNVNVTQETTYSTTISMGLDLASWISAGSTTDYPLNPSSYANFAALEADEEAIRQLMLVHNAVDYLATAEANDALIEDVINSDICAKWINLYDYALDTLSANINIKSVMDEADKYGYGEWGITDSTTTPPTWGALGCVPIMTADNAPYGNVIYSTQTTTATQNAYIAFSGTGSEDNRWVPTSSIGAACYLGYTFTEPVCAKKIKVHFSSGIATTFKIQGSNDGFASDINDITSDITQIADGAGETDITLTNDNYYRSYRFYITTQTGTRTYGGQINLLQFYGRELKQSTGIPTMTSNTTPSGVASESGATEGQAYYLFDGNSSTRLYKNNVTSASDVLNVDYEFDEPMFINAASITLGTSSTHYAGSVKLYGYVNGDWEQLGSVSYTKTESTNKPVTKNFTFTKKGVYEKVRFSAPAQSRDDSGYSAPALYEATCTGFSEDVSEKEFAQGSTRKTIYDHGVILNNTFDIRNFNESYKNIGEKRDYEIYMKSTQSNANPPNYYGRIAAGAEEDLTNYSRVYIRTGMESYMDNQGGLLITTSSVGGTEASVGVTNKKEVSLDITSFNTTRWIIIMIGTTGNYYSFNELWLE